MKNKKIFYLIFFCFLLTLNLVSQQGTYKQLMEYDGSNRLLYLGKAQPGTAATEAKWQIQKFIYDGASTRIIQVLFANGSEGFVHIWDNRTLYSYAAPKP